MLFPVDGSEKMGNRSGVVSHGLAAILITDTKLDAGSRLTFPARTLTISDLVPGQTVVFSFANLPKDAQTQFRSCFSATIQSKR